jgi:hypothetical protein
MHPHFVLVKKLTDPSFLSRINAGPAKPLAFSPGASEPCLDALDDHGSLEFAEYRRHGEECPAGWGRRVHILLIQIEIDVLDTELVQQP